MTHPAAARPSVLRSWSALALTCMLALVAMAVQTGRANALNTCFRAIGEYEIFYSSAAHTKVVGRCTISAFCGVQPGCTGTTSNFVQVVETVPCEYCPPS
jgi:hypothetical protein